jgi:excisionase family DNA binding protein
MSSLLHKVLADGGEGTAAMLRSSEVFSITEVAAFLGAHEQTVRRLARRGAIPAFKVGKDWRFRKEAILRWSEEQQRDGGRCSVLVVDDNEEFCHAIGRLLDRFGCRVRRATAGKEGLELVAREAPGLILLDVVMPEMNGIQFLELLREAHPDLPVVLVTGYPNGELMQQATQHAPVMLLAKPVDAQLLERTVRSVFGGKLVSTSKGQR